MQKINAIVTCHNYARYLSQCLNSVLAQTERFNEIIVVDDSSDDDTRAVADCYHHAGVKYLRGDWRHVGRARNAGYRAIEPHQFALFVDADNWLDREFNAHLLAAIQENDHYAAAYPNLRNYTEAADGTVTRGELNRYVFPVDEHQLHHRNAIDTCSLVRRSAFEQVGGWAEKSNNVRLLDWELWLRMARLGWKFRHEPAAELNYRRHAAQMSAHDKGEEGWNRRGIRTEPLRTACQVAIITLFCGRDKLLDSWRDSILRCGWPLENIHVVAIDNSCDEAFSMRLKSILAAMPCSFTYHADTVKPGGAMPRVFSDSVELRTNRKVDLQTQVARLYATARSILPPGAYFVASLEDDIQPATGWIDELVDVLYSHNTAAFVGGCAPSRFARRMILWAQDNNRITKVDENGPFAINRTGFYCCVFRRKVFDAITLRPSIGDSWRPQDLVYDWSACDEMRANGHTIYATGAVRCEHLDAQTGQPVVWTAKTFAK